MTQSIKNVPERIWLCGFMGAGKSTLGRMLAERIDRPFLDLDRVIEERAGASVPEIFEREGEEGFRERERACLMELSRDASGVVALGGGALQNPFLVEHLKLSGLLIFIDTPFSVIFDRIEGESGRPLAGAGNDPENRKDDHEQRRRNLKELHQRRRPLYEQAELSIAPGGAEQPEELVDQLITKIRLHVSYL